MKVLVTGATTPFGSAVVKSLLASPDVELVLATGIEPWSIGLQSDGPRFRYAPADLAKPRETHDLLYGIARELGIDAVLHGVLHRRVRDRGERIHAIDVDATRHLLVDSEGHPTIRRFVFRSCGGLYAVRPNEATLLDEDQALEHDPRSPQWLRDRIEADALACARMGLSPLAVAVLRPAETLAEGAGSQLWDYLGSRVCLRPLGFDPMINLLSLDDSLAAIHLALASRATGVFNIPGYDTLPLRDLVRHFGRLDVPVPGPLLHPLYALRGRALGSEFRYGLNLQRLHFGGTLDGTRARKVLGYAPSHPIAWPARVHAA